MAKKYGYYTGELAIEPFLSQHQVWMDCRDEILPTYRRPGKTAYYVVAAKDVEPYYRSKGIPDDIIQEKLKELKIFTETEQLEILTNIISQRLKIPKDTIQLNLLTALGQA
jgi:hypothetical protein